MKKIFALILVLVLALAVFSSCGKKEEVKTADCKYTIYNRTGSKVTNITFTDTKKEKSAFEIKTSLEDGAKTEFTFNCIVDDTGTPNLRVEFKTENGGGAGTSLNQKTDSITLGNGTITFEAPKE